MHDGAIIAIVAITFGALISVVRIVFGGGRHGRHGRAGEGADSHSQRELFDLAMRLQSRVESLERLLDSTQPEWRGKA
jgi:phage shock protein B